MWSARHFPRESLAPFAFDTYVLLSEYRIFGIPLKNIDRNSMSEITRPRLGLALFCDSDSFGELVSPSRLWPA